MATIRSSTFDGGRRSLPLSSKGADKVFIHALADVEDGAEIGNGTTVWRFAHVRTGAIIGENCMLGNGVYVDKDVRIGSRVKIQNGVLVYAGVVVEDEVFLGPHMTFTNDLYPRAVSPEWVITPTRVRRGASVGANATIVCGVEIGEYAMVAAGSVVTKDVPAFTLVRGNPARPAGYVCVCGKKLASIGATIDAPITCTECGRTVDLPAILQR